MSKTSRLVIGMDPHKRSATIEAMAAGEQVPGGGRFGTDPAGFGAMLAQAGRWPDRVQAAGGLIGPRGRGDDKARRPRASARRALRTLPRPVLM